MQPLGVDYDPVKCDQCHGKIEDGADRYECMCGATLCHLCYGICEVCDDE